MPESPSLFHISTRKWGIFIRMFGSESMLICSLAARRIRTPSSNARLPPLSPPSPQTELGQKLSLCSKLCFAIGGAPKEVAASATAFFLQIYLLDIAQVTRLMSNGLKKERICVSSECVQCISIYLCFLLTSPDQRCPGLHGAVYWQSLGCGDWPHCWILHYKEQMDQDWQTHALVRRLFTLLQGPPPDFSQIYFSVFLSFTFSINTDLNWLKIHLGCNGKTSVRCHYYCFITIITVFKKQIQKKIISHPLNKKTNMQVRGILKGPIL